MSQPLNFKNDRYILYECENDDIKGKKWYNGLRLANAFCWLNLLKNVYRFRIIRTIFWMIPTIFTQLSKNAFREHYAMVV